MSEIKKWNRQATYRLLRYGRKNDGGWSDAECFWDEDVQAYKDETLPDDNDTDLVIAAPDLLAAVQAGKAYAEELSKYSQHAGSIVNGKRLDDLFEKWIELTDAAIAKATGKTG